MALRKRRRLHAHQSEQTSAVLPGFIRIQTPSEKREAAGCSRLEAGWNSVPRRVTLTTTTTTMLLFLPTLSIPGRIRGATEINPILIPH